MRKRADLNRPNHLIGIDKKIRSPIISQKSELPPTIGCTFTKTDHVHGTKIERETEEIAERNVEEVRYDTPENAPVSDEQKVFFLRAAFEYP